MVGRCHWYRSRGFPDSARRPWGGHNKVVVLKALSGNAQRPYYALLTQNFPQLISVPRDGLLADASEETLPQIVHMRVLLGEQSALLPEPGRAGSRVGFAGCLIGHPPGILNSGSAYRWPATA